MLHSARLPFKKTGLGYVMRERPPAPSPAHLVPGWGCVGWRKEVACSLGFWIPSGANFWRLLHPFPGRVVSDWPACPVPQSRQRDLRAGGSSRQGKMGSEGVLSPGRGYGFGCWGGVGLNQDAHLSTWRPPLLALPKPAPAIHCPEP